MNYSHSIKTLRDKMMLTQTELGELLGVSYTTICRWETGKFVPTIKLKRKLKDLFETYKINEE